MFGANLYERHLPVLARQLTPSAVEGTAKTLALIPVVIGVSFTDFSY
jgi:hypothetical protein